MNIRFSILGLIFILAIGTAQAQNNTGTPYSIYGFGLMTENAGPYTGMGGVSAAMRDNTNINYLNPASYTALDSNRFQAQFGLNGERVRISTHQEAAHYKVAQNAYFNIALRIRRHLYAAIGFTELSDIGYDLTYTNGIPGSTNEKYTQLMQGEGGLNQFHFGLAWQYKNLSIGANLGVIFGKIEKRQTLSIPLSNAYSILSSDNNRIHDIIVTMGAQYVIPITGNQKLTLGTDFNLNSKLYGKRTYLSYKNSENSSTIMDNDELQKGYITYPFRITSGAAWSKGTKWLVAGDYTFQKMSDYKEFDQNQNLKDYHKATLGASYTPEKFGRKWGRRNSYELGSYFVRSHVYLNNRYINTYAVTAGIVMPFYATQRNMELDLKISMDYGLRGSEANGLMREQFLKFRISVGFKELWFLKRKIN